MTDPNHVVKPGEVTDPIEDEITDPELEIDGLEGPEDPSNPPSPTPPLAPGDQTPPNLLLQSLQQERAKVKQLEDELRTLKSSPPPTEGAFSDEGKALEARINQLTSELETLKTSQVKKELLAAYPVLKDKWDEFEAYRSLPENAGMSLQAAAKVYLAENGMFTPRRRGVERPTGGRGQQIPAGTITPEEAERLRTSDSKKYREMLKNGQIKIASS